MRINTNIGGEEWPDDHHTSGSQQVNGFGIEEEFFLIDRSTGLPATPTPAQTATLTAITAGGGLTTTEWLACQIEMSSAILTDGHAALVSLKDFRRAFAATADQFSMDAIAVGTAPQIPHVRAAMSDGDRYEQFNALAPGFAADQYIGGMHVHVSIPDRDAGVRALNGLRPWLPTLTALGANSPIWRGEDTGFASWRSIHYSRWTASGVPPHFHDAADYDARVSTLLDADVVLNRGCLNWLARLPAHLPTIEIRTCDVQLQADDAVALALLIRALVLTAMRDPTTSDCIPAERFAIAQWQAARNGLDSHLFDPASGRSLPAQHAVWRLFDHAQPCFATADEEAFVRNRVQHILDHGTGATRQRAAFTTGGIDGLLRYAARKLTD